MVTGLAKCFEQVERPWNPLIVGALNGQHVKVGVLDGRFVWHAHDAADEMFLVLEGRLTMRYRDRPDETVEPGQFTIVPRGVDHLPEAMDGPVKVLLFEPEGTVNTGTAGGERTVVPAHFHDR